MTSIRGNPRTISDNVMALNTGHTPDQWVDVLDAAGVRDLTSAAIARLVHENHGVDTSWAERVAAAYEHRTRNENGAEG